MDSRIYPTFSVVEDRGLIPSINLPRNFKDYVERFYQEGKKEGIEEYVDGIRVLIEGSRKIGIRLRWDEQLGLTNISVGVHGGLDLEEKRGCFVEHNLGWDNSLIASAIATKYVSELLKFEE